MNDWKFKLLDIVANMFFSLICSAGLAMVIYNSIHSDGQASVAISSIVALAYGVTNLIIWNKK